jgi:DNA-binding LacI/PurR family transcriptional regulator
MEAEAMGVTQKQIAEEVGLSRSLVAQALGGHPKVSERTRKIVEEASQRLGYTAHSNAAARSLIGRRYGKRAKTGTLAVLLPDEVSGAALREMPFYVPMLRGMEQEALQRGIDLCICPQRSALPRLIEERAVDGVVCVENSPLLEQIRALGVPVVAIDFPSALAHTLTPQEREGTRDATEHLIQLGHRAIAYIGFATSSPVAAERLAGYREALAEHGLAPDEAGSTAACASSTCAPAPTPWSDCSLAPRTWATMSAQRSAPWCATTTCWAWARCGSSNRAGCACHTI